MKSHTINPEVLIGQVTATASGTSSKVRCTVANHGLVTGNKVLIKNVAGTTEANGYWTITYVDANNFDLDGTTYANTFTNAGGAYKIQVVKAILSAASSNVVVRANTRFFGSALIQDTKSYVKKVSNTSIELFRSNDTYAIILDFIKMFSSDGSNKTLTVTIENFDCDERYCNTEIHPNEVIVAGAGTLIISSDGRTVTGIIDVP